MRNVSLCKSVVLFSCGVCLYNTIEVWYRGVSYPIMGICGGLAVLILDQINDRISWDTDILIQSAAGSLLITFFELVIGELALHTNLFPVMWDYSSMPLNFDGVICLPFSLIWMVLSSVAILLADAINYYVFEEYPTPYYKLFGRVIIRFPEKEKPPIN